jgi:hypothetical protein
MDTWDDKQTGQKRTKLRVVGEACGCWVAVGGLVLPMPRAKIDNRVAPRPAHRRNHRLQLRRTKTRSRFE